MPGTVIGTSLNLGYAGKVSRNAINQIASRFSKSILDGSNAETMPNIPFGAAVVLNTDNTYSLFGATGAGVTPASAAAFAGIAVAEIKQIVNYMDQNQAVSYLPNQPVDVLNQGSCTVFCKEGTPTAGGKVYIVTVKGDNSNVGDLIATATPAGAGATAVELTNVKWKTGKVDANKISEITILNRVSA